MFDFFDDSISTQRQAKSSTDAGERTSDIITLPAYPVEADSYSQSTDLINTRRVNGPDWGQLAPLKSIDAVVRERVGRWIQPHVNSKCGPGSRQGIEERDPEYNFAKIARLEQNESMVRQAFKKTVERVMNSGWYIHSKDPKVTKWVNQRLLEIEERSGVPLNSMLTDMLFSIVRFSNCLTVVHRYEGHPSAKPVRIQDRESVLNPISHLEVLDLVNIRVEMNTYTKRAYRWKVCHAEDLQGADGSGSHMFSNAIFSSTRKSQEQIVSARNVIHMWDHKYPGFVFGSPFIMPVIPDIIELRRAEELAGILAYQSANPLVAINVGTEKDPPRINDDGGFEIDDLASYFGAADMSGFAILSYRHEIKKILEGQDLGSLKPHLDYWRQRVMEGLNLNTISLGNSAGVSKSSSVELSREGYARAKYYARVLSDFMNAFLINQLVREGGFDPFNDETTAQFIFNEIDLETMVLRQTHALALWQNNGLTHEEFRNAIGKEALDPSREGELYFRMIQEATEQMKAEAKIKMGVGQQRATGTNQHGSKSTASTKRQ